MRVAVAHQRGTRAHASLAAVELGEEDAPPPAADGELLEPDQAGVEMGGAGANVDVALAPADLLSLIPCSNGMVTAPSSPRQLIGEFERELPLSWTRQRQDPRPTSAKINDATSVQSTLGGNAGRARKVCAPRLGSSSLSTQLARIT